MKQIIGNQSVFPSSAVRGALPKLALSKPLSFGLPVVREAAAQNWIPKIKPSHALVDLFLHSFAYGERTRSC